MNIGLLLSGGMDSIALAYWKRPQFAYTVDYGQLAASGEIQAAATVCKALDIHHHVIRANCRELGLGDMAGVPPSKLSPVTEWWPFRNQLLITLVGAKAISDNVAELMFGAIATDTAHKDGRKEFFQIINQLMTFQEGNLRVVAPAINLDAASLVTISGVPREILAWSHSCHVAPYACGNCRGCVKHAETMKKLGYEDY